MLTNINITQQSEISLKTIKKIAEINGKPTNKGELINLVIDIANNVISGADEETLINLTGLKKTI
jgi:hypothetical protein